MRDSFHDDRLLDRIMQEKFPQMLMAVRAMAPEAVRAYVAEMHPAILREYRLALVRRHVLTAGEQALDARTNAAKDRPTNEPIEAASARTGRSAPMISAS
jgi:hypothetical protein